MRTRRSELQDGEAEGNLSEDEARKLSAFRDMNCKSCEKLAAAAVGGNELIRSADPHLRRNWLAAMVVAGRRRRLPFYNMPEFQVELAKLISADINKGKTGFIQDLAELTGKPEVENRQSSCLAALLDFYEQEARWPTKAELRIFGEKAFPEFLSMDEKEWRRLRTSLGLEWLEDSPAGRPRNGGH
jgi:hypothetical protein